MRRNIYGCSGGSGLYVNDGIIFLEIENALNKVARILKSSFDIAIDSDIDCNPKTLIEIQIEHDKENHCIFIYQKKINLNISSLILI